MKAEEKPVWKEGLEKPSFPKLETNIETDVAIVGGGLAGVLTAYLLSRSGKKVALLEKKKIGSGATEYTTAFITQDVDTHFSELITLFGEEKAKLVWQSGADAISLIEKIVDEEKIDCEFMRTEVSVYANSEKQFKELQEEYGIITKHGFELVAPVQDENLNFLNYGYYQLKNQAKFHPLKFLNSLAETLQKSGVKIFEQSEVSKINHNESGVSVEAGENVVEAKRVVIATYQPFHNRIRLFLKRGMYRSYVLAANLPKELIKEGLYWDTENPYHYFRIDAHNNFDRMILGGEDVKTIFKIDQEKIFQSLEEYLKKILRGQNYEITHRWVGPILEPSDGLALIGETYDNEYVATAFSGNGMTYSAISAMVLSDAILGFKNIYGEVYDPKRIPNLKQLFIKGSDYMGEFFGGAGKNLFKKKQASGV